jgi:carboxypeptidase family protein/TonB-dependent receptor-like protein
MQSVIRVFAIAACLCSTFSTLWAQKDTGTIAGIVRDSSGAVVPGASITVTNTQTNIAFHTVSGADGSYTAPALRPGEYSVTVERAGFKKEVRSGLVLQVNQVATVDLALQVGEITEITEVRAAAPLIQTQSVTLGDVISEKQVRELPLNGRNFVQLLTLTAGATPGISRTAQSSGGSLSSVRAPSAVQINGQSNLSTNFLLDGIDNMETSIGGIILFPPVDAIQEFKVQTLTSDSEFGVTGGGQVNVTTKSGTNAFHGSLFEFLRNDKLDAKNFFDAPDRPIPPFKLNQFGATAGGPLRRDRTFWFADYEGSRIRQGQTFVLTVPTQRMRQGDFSELSGTIFDPATYNSATNARQPFPSNRIPTNRLSQAALNLMEAQYPLPSRPGLANNFIYNPIRPSNMDNFDVRVDHQLTAKDNVFVRYGYSDFDAGLTISPRPVLPSSLLGIDKALDTDPVAVKNQLLVVAATHTLRHNLLNEFRFGYTRFNEVANNRLHGIQATEKLGIRNANSSTLPFTDGLPGISISGFSTIGELEFLPFINVINTFQYIDNLSYIKGKHTLKFGGDVRRRQFNFFQPPTQRGTFSFSGAFTNNPASPAGTGSGMADFALGLPLSSSQEAKLNGLSGQRSTEWGWYASDTWRLTSRLTLSLGLRYELTSPRTEVADRQSNFDTTVPGGGFRVASPSAPFGRALRTTDKNNFAPRIGIAYQVTNRSVVRAGYGIFYDLTGYNRFQGTIFTMVQNPPYTSGQNIVNSATQPTNRLEDGFPAMTPVPVVDGVVLPNAVPGFTFSGRWQDPDMRTTYMQDWHLTTEHEVLRDLAVTASYVGVKATKFFVNLGINDPRPGAGAVAPRRPFPAFANINGQADAGSSTHHSAQLTVKKRYTQGLTLLTSYTYGKTLSDYTGEGSKAQDFYNRGADRGRLNWDIRSRLIASFNYELPFGPGKKFASGVTGASRRIIEGWSTGGIANFYSGEPFTVGLGTAVANTGLGSRANRISPCDIRLDTRTPDRWFNTDCFNTPANLTYGNAGIGILEGPGTKQVDWSVLKNTSIDEHRSVQLRVEFFNVFNTPQFNLPNATLGNSAYGRISGAGIPVTFSRLSRQIQFALKFFW